MSETPRSEHFDDIYFAAEDGLAERKYGFLEQNNLPAAWENQDRFVIAETGFGTGLNFLCAWTEFEKTATASQHLYYYSFEKHPLSQDEIRKYLNHWSGEFGGRLEKLCALYPYRIGGWHQVMVSPQVTLILIFDDVNRAIPELNTEIDCWFLDGHAPAKNPDMWSETVFKHIGRLSKNGTRVSTFTAAGIVKRGLQSVGFTISKSRGFDAKKDMITGVFDQKPEQSKSPRQICKKIAIIGGGIAGASLAYALSEYECETTIFEKTGLASAGSGNARGLCNPRITAHRGGEADFYSPAFNRAHHLFREISHSSDIGFQAIGCLHLITDDAKDKRYNGFANEWAWHHDHARIISTEDCSDIAGIKIDHSALYLPNAGMVSPRKATEYMAKSATVIIDNITSIAQIGTGWRINNIDYECVVLAGSYDVLNFPEAAHLPLQKIRGQITEVSATPLYKKLKANLCYGGYASIAEDGKAIIGSTFQPWMGEINIRPEDDIDNLEKLREAAPLLAENLEVVGHRASFRSSAKDRTPIIGQINTAYNLYISTAHGSHGIISSIMAADLIAAKIMGAPQILPTSVDKFLSPTRFKMR